MRSLVTYEGGKGGRNKEGKKNISVRDTMKHTYIITTHVATDRVSSSRSTVRVELSALVAGLNVDLGAVKRSDGSTSDLA